MATAWLRSGVLVGALVLGGMLAARATMAQVSVNVNIGPPPIVVAAPPALVVVPGTPVYYAPQVQYNYFYYGKRYYTFHDGHWFYGTSYNGPWVFVAPAHVPAPVLGVPVSYYRIPPGHWKHGGPPGHGRGHKKWKDD
jgi:hypothetical protein